MNVSHLRKCVWWAPQRVASRATWTMLAPHEFRKPTTMEIGRHSVCMEEEVPLPPGGKYVHHIGLIPGTEKYFLMMNIRNPYSRAVSMWNRISWRVKSDGTIDYMVMPHLNNKPSAKTTFEEYVLAKSMDDGNKFLTFDNYEVGVIKCRTPDLYIRYEHLEEDILKIPFITLKDKETKKLYKGRILKMKDILIGSITTIND